MTTYMANSRVTVPRLKVIQPHRYIWTNHGNDLWHFPQRFTNVQVKTAFYNKNCAMTYHWRKVIHAVTQGRQSAWSHVLNRWMARAGLVGTAIFHAFCTFLGSRAGPGSPARFAVTRSAAGPAPVTSGSWPWTWTPRMINICSVQRQAYMLSRCI